MFKISTLFLIISTISTVQIFTKASLIDTFEDWVHKFEVKFHDEIHFTSVYRIWSENNNFIEKINSMNLSYTLGHNQFSGMDEVEYHNYLGYSNEDSANILKTQYLRGFTDSMLEASLPTSINWVEKGAVTPVKDQGQCGSCWTFSTTGALEGAYFTTYGKLPSFSEQQLVDCDNLKNGGKDHGCNGGLMDNAFSWIQKNGGLCEEKDYPYTSGVSKTAGTAAPSRACPGCGEAGVWSLRKNPCQTTCLEISNSKVSNFVDVSASSDNAMMSALAKQPVSIAIEADQKEFQLYKSGVFSGTCGIKLDHGVLVVGYGSEENSDFYLVKNSWGTSWGDGGYIKLGRGKQYNNGDGQCGMLLEGSYPLL
jgi:C1A family cysteine protease